MPRRKPAAPPVKSEKESPLQRKIAKDTPPRQKIAKEASPRQEIAKEQPTRRKIAKESPARRKIAMEVPSTSTRTPKKGGASKTTRKRPILFLTCEHAGNEIPTRYLKLFGKNAGVLRTHRGSDPGAFAVAKEMANLTRAKFFFTKVSRLVVDMNRSPNSDSALSRWTKSLSEAEQTRIFATYYFPYRSKIESAVAAALKTDRVLHLGIHSFSPYLDASRKSCDIGLLFDPKNELEVAAAESVRKNLELLFPDLGIKMNYPYRGDADGLTTDLRRLNNSNKVRTSPRYAGLEIEFNQAFLKKMIARETLKPFVSMFVASVQSSLDEI